ncbi:MAG: amidoligase family protein [Myxococcota bacterium]|nr:amidoligase family protein [Myxococcota bacterium]
MLDSAGTFGFNPAAAASRRYPFQERLVTALNEQVARAEPGARLLLHVATGGGKTRIANDWLASALRAGQRVLWLAKDWTLLQQAAADLCGRHQGCRQLAGYIGQSPGSQRLSSLVPVGQPRLVYTTLQTWGRRASRGLATSRFDFIVVDEVHWGVDAPTFRRLDRLCRASVILGLTATPRPTMCGWTLVGEHYGFDRLVDAGVLAAPARIEAVRTQVAWRPSTGTSHGDFSSASLRELATDPRRNRQIVERYVRHQGDYGKTLVFACDIDHAEQLAASFQARGVAAEATHCRLSAADQDAIEHRFREGRLRVLVNVAKLTHGVDIPDIRTVFLARPTTSQILFSQMVGRAARRTAEKTTFNVIDFVDNLQSHRELLVGAQNWFCGGGGDREESRPATGRGPAFSVHAYLRSPIEHLPIRPGCEELVGLDLHPGQTFGVELELTRPGFDPAAVPDWSPIAHALLTALPAGVPRAVQPLGRGEIADDQLWNVKWDGSCGWELTSRILRGSEGFWELFDVCAAIGPRAAALGLTVNARTGAHVHLAWTQDVQALRWLYDLVAHFEPALLSLVAPSRARNGYCKSLRAEIRELRRLDTPEAWQQAFADPESRYLALNPRPLWQGRGTLEVRLHSGTLEGPKILTWISLWMRLLHAAELQPFRAPRHRSPGSTLPLSAKRDGDILILAGLLGVSPELSHRLAARRLEVVRARWRRTERYAELARQALTAWTRRSAGELCPRALPRLAATIGASPEPRALAVG